MNLVNDCICYKFCGSKHIFLVLYVVDNLLASKDINLLHETKGFLAKNSKMKDLGNASFAYRYTEIVLGVFLDIATKIKLY